MISLLAFTSSAMTSACWRAVMKSCEVERRPWEEVKRPEIMDLLEEENLALLEWETAPPRGGRRC